MTLSVEPTPEPPTRRLTGGAPAEHASFGHGMAVLGGWYATVAAALALWISTLPDVSAHDGDCHGFGCGWSPQDNALLLLYVLGIPSLAVGAPAAVLTLYAVAQRLESAVAAGTLAAAVGVIGVPVVVVLGLVVAQ